MTPATLDDSAAGTSAPRRRIPLLAIFIFWTCWSLWSAQQNIIVSVVSGQEVRSWLPVLLLALSTGWFWAILTPLIMLFTRAAADRYADRVRLVAAHIAFFLVLHVVDAWYYSLTTAAWAPAPRPFQQLVFALTSVNAWTYALIAVVTTLVDYHDALRERNVRAERLEAQLAQAQFQALRAQLHPHFLFNALNAISALIHKDPARADRMLARLSELLRIAIDTAGSPEIKLIDEIDFVNRYLEIERMRFGERLDVRVDLAADTYDALVPNMLLQPIVENAVRHGVAPHPGPGRVEIQAQRRGTQLGIVVRDTGNGMTHEDAPNEQRRTGVGLRATRDRLQKLYGSAHELSLVNVPGGGFETRLLLPFRCRDDAAAR